MEALILEEKLYIVKPDTLVNFCKELFCKNGMDETDAGHLAGALVDNEMRGIKSHGVLRVYQYLKDCAAGIYVAEDIEIVKETPVSAVVDGKHGIGMAIAGKAVSIARNKAKEFGVGIVSVRNSSHLGAIGEWSLKLAGDDMIGVCISNTPPILSAPTGNTRVIGSNPFSISIPAGDTPAVCLDISNGIMAMGKIAEYKRLNKPLPEGAWLDGRGNPTTDPASGHMEEYIMRPVGSHKGFGLAIIAEILTALLAGGEYGTQIGLNVSDKSKGQPNSHFFFAMRIDMFQDLDKFTERLKEFIDYIHASPTAEGKPPVIMPGEIEYTTKEYYERVGLVLPEDIIAELRQFSEKAGLNFSILDAKLAPPDIKAFHQI